MRSSFSSARTLGFGSLFKDQLNAGPGNQTSAGQIATTTAAPAQAAASVSTTASQAISTTASQAMVSGSKTTSQSAAASAAASSVPAATQTADATSQTPGPNGSGLTTASGAPLIILNPKPAAEGTYTGPAAYNPYYYCTGVHFQAGAVVGYENWFQSIQIGNPGEPGAYKIAPQLSANLEGGQEALRLIQQYQPNATLVATKFPMQQDGQPVSYDVVLPNGVPLSAGLILTEYYHDGYGVSPISDSLIMRAAGVAT